MFAYCNSNPVKFSDSTGNIIEISTDASDEEKELYLKAVEYLQASETARALWEKVEAADVVFTIVIVYGNDKATAFDYQAIIPQWPVVLVLFLTRRKIQNGNYSA